MSTEERPDRPDPGEGEAQDSSPAWERSFLIRCLRLAPGALALVCAIIPPSLIFDWSIGPPAEVALAVAASGILGFHLVNIFRTRVKLGHWEMEGAWDLMRSEILVGCVLPIWVIALVLALSPTWWMLLLLAGVFGFSQLIYEQVQREIRKKVEKANKEHGTKHFRKRKFLIKFGVGKSLDEMAEEEQGPGLWKGLIALGEEPWQAGLSRTRSLIVYAFIACAGLAGAASADVYIHEELRNKDTQTQTDESEEETAAGNSNGGGDVGGGGGQEGSGEYAGSEHAGKDEGDRCRFDPGLSIPDWARRDLYALYYGGKDLDATAPPGTDVGGCPGKVFVLPTPEGIFVYTIGRGEDGEIISVAVTSKEGEAAIFLAPAAQRVIELIHGGGLPLGGYPRVDVIGEGREGDMAPITTPRGTIILVRTNKVLPGSSEYASPYLELPVTVAAAWTAAMRAEGSWLWPLEPHRYEGTIDYRFSRSPDGTEGQTRISYDPGTTEATAGGFEYRSPQIQLSQSELEEFARRAGE
jgi:hypothetical protein